MNDRDVLKRASEALRDATEPSADEVARLRARVLSRGKVTPLRKNDRKKSLRWVLPLAAAFIAGSALAATPGALDGMLGAVERYLDIELFGRAHQAAHKPAARPSSAQPKSGTPAISPLATVTPEPDAVAVNVPAPDSPPLSPSAARATHRPVRPSSAGEAPMRPTPVPATEQVDARDSAREQNEKAEKVKTGPSRDLALYNQAHELHFRERRYNEALFAWDEYLGLTPTPTFALEARYNRALCLLRLGHYEEARAALVPFAEGRFLNGYRRDEATRFIQALDKRR